jgi:8-oxo-dGTP pyrophosphatase MutT (NUDIX family)
MGVEPSGGIIQVSSKIVYTNPWMTVREDVIRRGDGSEGTYAVVDKPDFALVIPFEHDGFWLIEQYRYPVSHRSWEFPQGTFPSGQTGTDEELATRELREETGLTAGSIVQLGRLHSAKGLSSQAYTVWLARDLTHGSPEREPEEQDMRQRWVSSQTFEQMARGGQITDDATLAAFALWALSR